MSNSMTQGYAGDVPAAETFERLGADPQAVLIDVRTQAEWNFVGVPDLSAIGREPLFLEWQSYPGGAPTADFTGSLQAALEARGASSETPLYFLCRSGGRSRAAAIAMTGAGYRNCFNISDGFEGPLDDQRHRGVVDGWKQQGLPWRQS